jgi:hypothetical protein
MDRCSKFNRSLDILTGDALAILYEQRDVFPVKGQEVFSLTESEIAGIMKDKLKSIVIELGVYLHPREMETEIKTIREREYIPYQIPVITVHLDTDDIYDIVYNTIPYVSRSRVIRSVLCVC